MLGVFFIEKRPTEMDISSSNWPFFRGNLKVILITASNTWGLFLLVLLLGYGLVEVPRQIWQAGNKGYRLQKTYFDIGIIESSTSLSNSVNLIAEKLSAEKNDAEESVRESFRDTQEILDSLRDGHPYREYAETIMAKVERNRLSMSSKYFFEVSIGNCEQNETESRAKRERSVFSQRHRRRQYDSCERKEHGIEYFASNTINVAILGSTSQASD